MERKLTTGLVSMTALVAGADAVAAQDWSGLYAGLSANSNSGSSVMQPDLYTDEGYTVDSATVAGAFLGYRWNLSAKMVMGAEIAMQGAMDVNAPDFETPSSDYTLKSILDAKLSIGTPVGKALIYGFAGASRVTDPGRFWTDEYAKSGANFGVGVDYMVSDHFNVGMEFISRNMNNYAPDGAPAEERNLNTVSLRASFKF